MKITVYITTPQAITRATTPGVHVIDITTEQLELLSQRARDRLASMLDEDGTLRKETRSGPYYRFEPAVTDVELLGRVNDLLAREDEDREDDEQRMREIEARREREDATTEKVIKEALMDTVYTSHPADYPYRVWRENGTPAVHHAYRLLETAIQAANEFTQATGETYTVTVMVV